MVRGLKVCLWRDETERERDSEMDILSENQGRKRPQDERERKRDCFDYFGALTLVFLTRERIDSEFAMIFGAFFE